MTRAPKGIQALSIPTTIPSVMAVAATVTWTTEVMAASHDWPAWCMTRLM